MFIDTKINNEFHKNGQLAYTETIAVLAASSAGLYQNRRKHPNGFDWIRIGRTAKYFDNGQLAWELNYNNNGEVIKDGKPSFTKDGTIIIY